MDKVLVTGGAGFIGSHFVKRLLKADDVGQVTVLDALTYAGHVENLGEAFLSPKLAFVEGNILDIPLVDELVGRHDAVVHFAAESHVDRSFLTAGNFVTTNVLGTHTLLDAARRLGVGKFVHVSTDEVYGPLVTGSASERDPLRPTVPYAASKAASDMVALSHFHTYGVPVCVTRSSNNYGPCQHPEKIIPLFVTRLLKHEPVTLHGRGEHVRNWLHVEENCAAIELVLRAGVPGEIYNLGGGTDLTNKELTGHLLRLCGADWDAVQYVPDRQANDIRYSMTWSKLSAELGYQPRRDLQDGLAETVDWYRNNPGRWAPLLRNPAAPHAEIRIKQATQKGMSHA
ncbi:dTDP-glucose 4,6-dehydratase [Streptomyces sp. NPDC050485]|uniref:dTDP-glucose 4,6-dehydratase n=1 Tax=Streptomyces sp. NPDC050485 TaxID=3365617 RepID=UPI0037A23C7A